MDYTDNIFRDVLVAGIYDTDIRREIMGVESIIERSVNEVVSLVEKREMARDANSYTSNVSVVSSYRREMKNVPAPKSTSPGLSKPCSANRKALVPCQSCGKQFPPFKEGPLGWNTKPFEYCINCYRSRRQQFLMGQGSASKPSVSSITNQDNESLQVVSQISSISVNSSDELPAQSPSTASKP